MNQEEEDHGDELGSMHSYHCLNTKILDLVIAMCGITGFRDQTTKTGNAPEAKIRIFILFMIKI